MDARPQLSVLRPFDFSLSVDRGLRCSVYYERGTLLVSRSNPEQGAGGRGTRRPRPLDPRYPVSHPGRTVVDLNGGSPADSRRYTRYGFSRRQARGVILGSLSSRGASQIR